MNDYKPPSGRPTIPYATPGVTGTGICCPKCGASQYKPVSFTWWGGLLGPKMFNHVKCMGCGAGFNGKTGKSNDIAIAIYLGVGVLIGVLLIILRISMSLR